jgi:hypothetical protein
MKTYLALAVAIGLLSSASAQKLVLPAGPDLKSEKFFSRPVTQLEILTFNLRQAAKESERIFRDVRGIEYGAFGNIDTDAGYDTNFKRLALSLKLKVATIKEPWRETCSLLLNSFYISFFFPKHGDRHQAAVLGAMERYFGEIVRLDPEEAFAVVNQFLESLVVQVVIHVSDGPKPLGWRRCVKDNHTGEIQFSEHQY